MALSEVNLSVSFSQAEAMFLNVHLSKWASFPDLCNKVQHCSFN